MQTVMHRSLLATVAMKALILLPCASILIATNSRADSGVIQLQQIPNGKDETEGADFYPPGVDTNLVISSGVNTNGHGSVVMTRNGAIQDFLVVANNLAQGPNAFNFAYGVFINDFPGSTNFSLIGVMDLVRPGKKTTTWRLEYIGTNAAPPELGVADLGDLVGLELRIIGSPLNPSNANLVFLHAILPPVLPDPAVNSGVKRVAMSIPPAGLGSPPSPYAQGTLTVKYDAVRGRTVISIKATKLTHGTGYAVFLEDAPGAGVYQEIEEMNEPIKFPNTLSSGFLTLDTQKGNPIDFFAHTPNDLAGRNIVVVDPFFDAFAPTNSSIHLIATMPSIP